MAKHADVEIFVRGCEDARLLAWFEAIAAPATVAWEREGATGYATAKGDRMMEPKPGRSWNALIRFCRLFAAVAEAVVVPLMMSGVRLNRSRM